MTPADRYSLERGFETAFDAAIEDIQHGRKQSTNLDPLGLILPELREMESVDGSNQSP